MVTVSDPVALEQKNCVSASRSGQLASRRYTSRNWKWPPLTSGAACSTVARMPSHAEASCGSRFACSVVKSCARTAARHPSRGRRQRIAIERAQFGLRGATRRPACKRRQQQSRRGQNPQSDAHSRQHPLCSMILRKNARFERPSATASLLRRAAVRAPQSAWNVMRKRNGQTSG